MRANTSSGTMFGKDTFLLGMATLFWHRRNQTQQLQVRRDANNI